MNAYLVFSDESGSYQRDRSESFIRRHPFYVRVSVIIAASEWKQLESLKVKVQNELNICRQGEVKWAHLWSLRNFQKKQKPILDGHELKNLEQYDYHQLIDYVDRILSSIRN
ncbi:MAG: hypothetical protein JXR70_03660 [Spirochaetales bacterium]|nr:hypothetical protein [Spirochaetales bacterium]